MSQQLLSESAISKGLAAASGTAALLLLLQLKRRRQEKKPPSVGGYPLLGSQPVLPEPWPRSIYERFGNEPIVMVYLGTEPVYVLNNWDAFKEAMVDNADAFSGRISQYLSKQIFGDIGGLVPSDGEVWREYRRFTLRVLRDFGLGRRDAEILVVTEADHLTASIDSANGSPIETTKLLSTASSNIICQLVFGSRLASEDPKFDEILELFRKITQDDSNTTSNSIFLTILPIVQRFPLLTPLLTASPTTKEVVQNFTKLLDYCKDHQDRHAAEMENVNKARDYIEAHLMHQKQNPGMFNDTRLMLAVSDLFLAGTDTTSNTLRWALLLMVDNPEVARKVRHEIHDAVGQERTPTHADKQLLPYTLATIEETLRISCLLQFGLFHRTTQKVTVSGYKIPADAIFAFNVYAIQHDEKYFPQPKRFLPERFIKNGQFIPCEQMAAFGTGRRACLGEGLARSELFVYFSTIMQRFEFKLDPSDSRSVWDLIQEPNLFKGSLMRAPPQYNMVFTRL